MKNKLILLLLFFVTFTPLGICQDDFLDSKEQIEFKQRNDAEISSVVSPFKRMADYIVGAALFLDLIIVIYQVSNNGKTGSGKKHVVSWVIALIVYLIVRDFM